MSGAVPVPGSRCYQETAPPMPGCAQPCPLALLAPGVRQGASGAPGDLPKYLALTLQAGLCRVGPYDSLASHGTKMEPFTNKRKNSKVKEAGAGVDAQLGLQRTSTNSPLQTALEESQVLTMAAVPGFSESVTNVVPQQIAMEVGANRQVTAGTSSDRK